MIRLKFMITIVVTFMIALSFHSTAAKTEKLISLDDGKAHYIVEIMKHTTWPNEAEIAHFNVLLLGTNENLFQAVTEKSNTLFRGKKITVQQHEHLKSIQGDFQAIFVEKNQLSLIPQLNQQYKDTLIISDGQINKQDLMVGILVSNRNLKLTLNRDNLVNKGFIITNSLLNFAGTKADLKDQLSDKESTLNEALENVKSKQEQLVKLNASLIQNNEQLKNIQSTLVKEQRILAKAQAELNSLKEDKKEITLALANQKQALAAQQALMTKKEIEQNEQEYKLHQLKLDIKENETKLALKIKALEQQNQIIEHKEQKITGQRKLLYITIAIALIFLLIKIIILKVSNKRKQANKKLASLNEQLYELATNDDMTKLFNRRHFLELAQRELSKLQRTKKLGVVLMIDIDHFKDVNDNYGHAAGDQAIINIANILKDNLREYDIVGRLGGEEFCMFLPNIELDIASNIAERIRNKVAELTTEYKNDTITLTVSIGLTATKPAEASINNILRRADKALYQAKNSGRNKVIEY